MSTSNEIWEDRHWSMSIATLQRIDNELRHINQIKLQYQDINLHLYATSLGILYDEVHPFLAKKNDRKQAKKLWERLTEEYNKYPANTQMKKVSGRNLLSACNALNLFLRRMLYQEGLLMNKPDEGWEDRF